MRASELINLLSQYDPDMEVPVSFTEEDDAEEGSPIRVASCASGAHSRCYQNIVETAQDGMMVVDPVGRVTYLNPFMCHLTGCKAEDILGRKLDCLVVPDEADFVMGRLQRQKSGETDRYSVRLLARDKSIHWVQFSATPIPSADGRYRGSMMTVIDLSHQQAHAPGVDDQESLGRKVERISEQLESLKVLRLSMLREVQELEALPRIKARPFWHQGRYLYLICPQKNGRRKREYIGSQPEKVKSAMAAVRRENRYQEIRRELQHIEAQIRTATFKLDSFLWELAEVPPDLHKLVG